MYVYTYMYTLTYIYIYIIYYLCTNPNPNAAQVPPVIDTMPMLREKLDMVEALLQVTINIKLERS